MSEWTKTSQRTVKCRTCNVRDFYLWTDGTRSELRDRDGNAHSHTADEVARLSASTTADTNGEREIGTKDVGATANAISDELAALIPDESHYRNYIPRKLNGMTDVEVLTIAYEANRAHAEGRHHAKCDKKCKSLPVNVLLLSDTGAGKNALVRAVAAKLRVPYLRVPLNGGATVDGLLGRLDLRQENGASVTLWKDGRLTLIARHGGIICLDEVNACPQQISFILHPMLDDERTCIIDDHSEAFRLNAGTFFIGTMNPDYAGTRTLNAALANRFTLPLEFDYDDAVEKRLIRDPRLIKVAKQLRGAYRMGDGTMTTPVGTRSLLNYEQNESLFGKTVANASFVSQFATAEEKVAVRQSMELLRDDATPLDIDADVNLDDPA